MDTLEVLTKARALIEKPDNWCQGFYARDKKGDELDWYEDNAHSYCLYGCLFRAAGVDDESGLVRVAQDLLGRAAGEAGLATFNDAPERTHAEVLAAFDKAIEAERSRRSISSAEQPK